MLNSAGGRFYHFSFISEPHSSGDFCAQKMERDIPTVNMPNEEPPDAWERCIWNALSITTSAED